MKSNAFLIEKFRSFLAIGNYEDLKKTYSASFPEIKDRNSSLFWDKLNMGNADYFNGNNPMAHHRAILIANAIKGNQITVLNVGFGTASLEETFFRKNTNDRIRWDGIDISDRSVHCAQKTFVKANFSVGNILDIEKRSNRYDFVIASEVMEHIQPRNTFKALHELVRVLKPGGMCIVSVPLHEGLEEMIAKGHNPNAHVRVYTPELIRAELEIVGLQVMKVRYLYAFHKMYSIKTFMVKYLMINKFTPNNIILFAKKIK